MKKSRYREEQIIGISKQHEAGVKTADLCREHGISAASFCGWKQKFGGMEVSEAQRLKAMEDENRRLKLLVAELSLHGEALKAVIRKTASGLAAILTCPDASISIGASHSIRISGEMKSKIYWRT
jgi:putative transposase